MARTTSGSVRNDMILMDPPDAGRRSGSTSKMHAGSARRGGRTGTASLRVEIRWNVATLEITAAHLETPPLGVGQSFQLEAVAMEPEGAALPDWPFEWTSSHPSFVEVGPDGLIAAVAGPISSVTITARAEELFDFRFPRVDAWEYSVSVDLILQNQIHFVRNGPHTLICSGGAGSLSWHIDTSAVTASGQIGISFDGMPGRFEVWSETADFRSLIIIGDRAREFAQAVQGHTTLTTSVALFSGGVDLRTRSVSDPGGFLQAVLDACP